MLRRRLSLEKRRAYFCTTALVMFALAPHGFAAGTGDRAPTLISTTGGKNEPNNAELKKAADAHNPQACAQYGEVLLRGDGVTKDIAQAMTYLRQAAEGGEANASFRLGKIYDDGELAPQDYAKALDYYTMAARAGVSEAQYNLGVMYVSAHGVKRDYVEGLAWLIIAAKNGAPSDGENQVRERLKTTNRQKQIAAAEQRAAEILKPPSEAPSAVPPPQPQAPAKIDIGDTTPAKITVAPAATPKPNLGSSLGGSFLPTSGKSPATSPANAEKTEPAAQKTP